MKPDGVVTAAAEPMEMLAADPVMDVVQPAGEGADQVPDPLMPSQEIGQGEPQPTETPAPPAKTDKSDKPTDPKAKTKGTAKPKTAGTTGTTGTKPASRPGTAQSRLLNGTQKPQTNGVTKKPTTGAADKKTTSTTNSAKKPAGPTGAPTSRSPTKPAERKSTGTTRPTSAPNAVNGAKTGAAQPLKKTPSAMSSEVKTKPKTTGMTIQQKWNKQRCIICVKFYVMLNVYVKMVCFNVLKYFRHFLLLGSFTRATVH